MDDEFDPFLSDSDEASTTDDEEVYRQAEQKQVKRNQEKKPGLLQRILGWINNTDVKKKYNVNQRRKMIADDFVNETRRVGRRNVILGWQKFHNEAKTSGDKQLMQNMLNDSVMAAVKNDKKFAEELALLWIQENKKARLSRYVSKLADTRNGNRAIGEGMKKVVSKMSFIASQKLCVCVDGNCDSNMYKPKCLSNVRSGRMNQPKPKPPPRRRRK